jgi:hypothetical protein
MDGAESAYYVGKRPCIDDLPFWGRTFVLLILLPLQRFAYRHWGHSDVESQAIVTSRTRAEHMVRDRSWFIQELPVNACLPEETCQYGVHDFPKAKSGMYRERHLPLVSVPREEIADMGKLTEEVREIASRIEARLST